MPSWMFYIVIITFFLSISGCGVKSPPFLDQTTNIITDE